MKPNKPSLKSLTDYALKLLSYRSRSEHEIRYRLQRKKASPSKINQVITKLKQLNLINDIDFCLWWQRQRDQFRPRSARILRLELIKKGVSKDIINQTLNFSLSAEIKRAKTAFDTLKIKNVSGKQSHQKIVRFLSSRGFPWDIIRQVMCH